MFTCHAVLHEARCTAMKAAGQPSVRFARIACLHRSHGLVTAQIARRNQPGAKFAPTQRTQGSGTFAGVVKRAKGTEIIKAHIHAPGYMPNRTKGP